MAKLSDSRYIKRSWRRCTTAERLLSLKAYARKWAARGAVFARTWLVNKGIAS